ncbi:PRC-barrel domain-containing protein [Saccharothrix hoggarensis]|uniref:PRC-barrel domain-containing protein n=1 Tax=Saccharothrix hoggarensis TaxID=913853 RepID=A0ABW3QVD0_9PSEU
MDRTTVDRLYDCDVLDRHGRPIGPVSEVWLADGRPLWATVRRAGGTTLVPILGAQVRERRLVVPVEEHEVAGAPEVRSRELSDDEQAELHDHYGLTLPEQRLVRHERGGKTSVSAPTTLRPRPGKRPAR